jgi:hypothetical protein
MINSLLWKMMSRDPKNSPSGKLETQVQCAPNQQIPMFTMHVWIQIAKDATQEKLNLKVKVLVAWHLHPMKIIQLTDNNHTISSTNLTNNI